MSSFKELVEAIVAKHHSLLRKELPKISELMSDLVAQNQQSDDLREAEQIFKKVRNKIETHLHDEETSLFPTGIALESGTVPPPCEMDLLARVEEMEKEHENCGNALGKISQTVRSVPATDLQQHVLETLQTVQDDLDIHVEKENTQVHPKFIELVGAATSKA